MESHRALHRLETVASQGRCQRARWTARTWHPHTARVVACIGRVGDDLTWGSSSCSNPAHNSSRGKVAALMAVSLHKDALLNRLTLALRSRRAAAPCAVAQQQQAVSTVKQQPWQQAVLEAMQEQHCKQTSEINTTSSCVTLDTQLDAVYDGLDDIFYSKVCGQLACQAARIQPQHQLLFVHLKCCLRESE